MTLNIVLEYANGGDLLAKITKAKKRREFIPETECWLLFAQILKGLNALHTNKIVHRDVKSANLFLTEN
jgi:NIMA (never in mitosis gene a)-related kinase